MSHRALRPGTSYLLRDYIEQSLYHATKGYFSNSTPPILPSLSKTTSLNALRDQQAYQLDVSSVYRRHDHGWMTPVQLFSPHLSNAIANRILHTSSNKEEEDEDGLIHVIEIGPGVGTLAKDILNYMPHRILKRLRYSLVEISPTLSRLQASALSDWIEAGVVNPVVADARKLTSTDLKVDGVKNSHVHIIATEVLDNLPHDLVRLHALGSEGGGGGDSDSEQVGIEEGRIHVSRGGSMEDRSSRTLSWQQDREIDIDILESIHAFDLMNTVPSSFAGDTLSSNKNSSNNSSFISDYLRSVLDRFINSRMTNMDGSHILKEIWVPTGCYQLLNNLINLFPTASFTITDFHTFPGSLPGLLAPVVQRVIKGSALTYDSVHEAPFGLVDILFPTDFQRVAHAHNSITSRLRVENEHEENGQKFEYNVQSQAEFFKRFASEDDIKLTTCLNGFNPVIQDFENVSYLLIDRKSKST